MPCHRLGILVYVTNILCLGAEIILNLVRVSNITIIFSIQNVKNNLLIVDNLLCLLLLFNWIKTRTSTLIVKSHYLK